MGRQSRSKKQKNKLTSATAEQSATQSFSPDELIQRGDYEGATAALEKELQRSNAKNVRLRLATVLSKRGFQCVEEEEGKLFFIRALDVLAPVPTPTDLGELRSRVEMACRAERWDVASECAERMIDIERSADTLFYYAVAKSRSFEGHHLKSRGGIEAVAAIDEALERKDAWPALFVYRADAEGWDEQADERRREVLYRGKARFPNSGGIAVALARAVADTQERLQLVLPYALAAPPHAWALVDAYGYADGTDRELSLSLIDAMESIARAPWRGFDYLRGHVELESGHCTAARSYFEKVALATNSRGFQFEGLLGLAATLLEDGLLSEALPCIERAYSTLFSTSGASVPKTEQVNIGGRLFSIGWVRGVNPTTTLRTIRAYLESSHLQSEEFLNHLWFLEHALESEFRLSDDFPLRPTSEFVSSDPRVGAVVARALQAEGRATDAFDTALQYAAWHANAGAEEEEEDDFLHCYWPLQFEEKESSAATLDFQPYQAIALRRLQQLVQTAEPAERDVVLRQVYVPLYTERWRHCLTLKGQHDEGLTVLTLLEGALSRETVLFDRGFYLIGRKTNEAYRSAEACYREYLEIEKFDEAAHNLGVALACQGRCKEAAEAYELAASWSTEPAKYLEAAERERRRGEEKELEAKQRAQAEREREDADARAFETERKRQQAFLATAPQRWAQLGYWPRRLLCTLHAIKEFESLDHLVELSGQDGRYVRGHYRKLVESGMITENDSGYIVNEHVVALVEREHSHSVVSSIVRADREIAVKLIFNSRNEYKIYQSLLEIFPNNLVFPNMALQGIFSYDRMKEILDGNCFGYFLRASVDFCVVSTASYFPIVAFEADSYWHESDHQKARDEMKDLIFAAGGMSLIRLRPYGTPSDTAIRGDIIAAVSKWLSGRSETRIGRTGFDPATELDLSQFQTLKVVDERR